MMTGIIVSGMLGLAPQILKTVESFSRASNPNISSMDKYEFAIAKGTYDHLCKKLIFLMKYLHLDTNIPEIQVSDVEDISRPKMMEFVRKVKYVLEQYDDYLSDKVLPQYCAEYFNRNIHDEKTGMNFELSIDKRLQEFDMTQLDAAILQSELQNFEPYIVNFGLGVQQDRFILVDKLISDSILALSRIHPSRFISATEQFVILPRSAPKWELSDGLIQKLSVADHIAGEVKLVITWKNELIAKLTPYQDLYEFEVSIRVETTKLMTWYYTSTGEEHKADYFTAKFTYSDSIIMIPYSRYNEIKDHIHFFIKIIGSINLMNITGAKVAKLHNIPPDNLLFGTLFTRGNYKLDDPVFSIDSIINNTIGSSQFSLQTSLSLCKAWQLSLLSYINAQATYVYHRYANQFEGIDILSLSAIGSHIIANEIFKDKSVNSLENLWTRILLDLEFMRKYIFRTSNGRKLVNNIL